MSTELGRNTIDYIKLLDEVKKQIVSAKIRLQGQLIKNL